MKQVLLDPKTGTVSVADVPSPVPGPNEVLVRTDVSVLSPGTEKQSVATSSQSLIDKVRARPDAARRAFEAALLEGPQAALWRVRSHLEHPIPLGYSLAGTVREIGAGVDKPLPGTRVACGGAGFATHSEVVASPSLLTAAVPDGVTQEEAAFTYVGAVALHAVRLAEVGTGGFAAVIGLGLLGQLVTQVLMASGVTAVGVEPNADRRLTAERVAGCLGASSIDEAVSLCRKLGGADAILVAAAGSDPDVMNGAIDMARDHGRIVVIGAVPIAPDRDRMYQKEISMVVARSAGPGRYESHYENQGVDYPVAHVRWTEGRNMAAFLELLRQGKLPVRQLITHRFSITSAEQAYDLVNSDTQPFLGITLEYPEGIRDATRSKKILLEAEDAASPSGSRPGIGVIGAGAFARSTLLPRLAEMPVEPVAVVTASGASAIGSAKRFGFATAATEPDVVLDHPRVRGVLIATRHDTHSSLTSAALRKGKHVYVEKPIALDRAGLDDICRAWASSKAILSAGFNRRFAPLVVQLHRLLGKQPEASATYVVSVPHLSSDSWILDPSEGGGVCIAEGGHFLDTLSFLFGSRPSTITAVSSGPNSYQATIQHESGSVGSILYTSAASGSGPKETLIVAGNGLFARLDDFRKLTVWRGRSKRTHRTRWQDKGHEASLRAWVDGMVTGTPPVAILDTIAVSEATICMNGALQAGSPVTVDLGRYWDLLGDRTAPARDPEHAS